MTGRLVLVALLVVAGCSAGSVPVTGSTGPTSTTSARPPSSSLPPAAQSAGGPGRPAAAVPGYLLNPAVTQATIGATICATGWAATVRPSTSYTTPLKRAQLDALGWPDQALTSYEEDHWIPLELGGAPRMPAPVEARLLAPHHGDLTESDLRAGNLWPELWSDARSKDQAEDAGKRAVCAGRATLAEARLTMFLKWGPRAPGRKVR